MRDSWVRDRWVRVLAFSALLLGPSLAGCHGVGPDSVARDRFDYSQAITESWKRQVLLNIVKIRYLDPPMFVDVGQIVAAYSVETVLQAGGTMFPEGGVPGDSVNLGAAARFTDRPTITYTPLTGAKFVRSLMTPFSPSAVFSTIESGWPADGVLLSALSSMNGLKNQQTSIAGVLPASPEFLRALTLFRKIQLSGAVGTRLRRDPERGETTIVTFRTKDMTPEVLADVTELRRLLKLDPDEAEIRLVSGATPLDNKELAVQTRSMVHILATVAAQADVPPEHVVEGRASPGWVAETPEQEATRFLHVRCGQTAPTDAYAAVKYRNLWFWVDDRDLRSKRSFAFLMILFTLSDTSEREPLPVITIPAQ